MRNNQNKQKLDQIKMETELLPKYSDLSSDQTTFLDQHFGDSGDLLSNKPSLLLSSLQRHCSDLDSDLLRLQKALSKSSVSWISRSFAAKSDLQSLSLNLQNLSLVTSQHGICSKRFHGVLGQELPKLADEVQRIEGIRSYVETTLRLEALVGDLEDAVMCFMNSQSGNMFTLKLSNSSIHTGSGTKHEKLLQAIKSMNDIENLLADLVGPQTHWHRLLNSVDARVDKALTILRPQVSADHRALLGSLGWPPKLSTSTVENGIVLDLPNPLTVMQGEKSKSYSNSFIALCALQHFQTRRELRKLSLLGQSQTKSNARLWAIDELVTPIASRVEYHFSKWVDEPEFIFALAHRITRNFIAGIDDVLQPLIDRARLMSCSAREAWVSAMVQTVSKFLETKILSPLAEKYKDKDLRPEVIPSWLHLIDLIIPFDKKMQSLVSLETCHFLTESSERALEDGFSRGFSLMNIFCERPEWLKIWAKIELRNACKKLKTDLQDDKCWLFDDKRENGLRSESEPELYLLSTREDHKAPLIAESAIKIAWEMIDRSQTMPSVLPRVRFIRSTTGKFLWYFFKVLLFRYKGSEIFPESFDDDAIRVSSLINAARYIEFRLRNWSDDVEFLEMRVAENKHNDENSFFFHEEVSSLSELETNWLMEVIAFVLRRFEALSWDYVNKEAKLLGEEKEGYENSSISVDFVEALDTLRCQLYALRTSLNAKDFLDLWRGVAEGLDHFISFGDIFAKIRFCGDRVSQFETDMKALFFVFKAFCVRPEAFFPNIKKGLEMLIVNKKSRDKKYATTFLPMEKD